MEESGMTDKQFSVFLRLIVNDLKEIQNLLSNNSHNNCAETKINELIKNLQITLES